MAQINQSLNFNPKWHYDSLHFELTQVTNDLAICLNFLTTCEQPDDVIDFFLKAEIKKVENKLAAIREKIQQTTNKV